MRSRWSPRIGWPCAPVRTTHPVPGASPAPRSGGLPAGPVVVHDLGSGTGAMMRWLAPLLPGPQSWVLHDADAAILHRRDPRPAVDADGHPVAARTSVEPLAGLAPDALAGASLVDGLRAAGRGDARRGATDRRRLPRRRRTGPVQPQRDRSRGARPSRVRRHGVRRGVRRPPARIADGRRLLGPGAAGVVASLFAAAGWRVRTAATPWRLGPRDRELVAGWLDGWLDAAVEQRAELGEATGGYRARRLAQLAAGRLRVIVRHRDLLAWPS